MPQIITLSHANAPKEQRQPNHPRSALLWPVLLYVKQCAGDKVDLVMLAHHPEAWKTHKRKHVCTHTHGHACTLTHTHTKRHTDSLLSSVTCSFPPFSLSHPYINAHTWASEGPMYVRALSKHSYGCYMLQLLPDGLGENILSLLFH